MFDIGFSEILMIAVVSLIVIGPKRLPETVRFFGYWLGRIRRSIHKARADMEREFGLDDIRRDLYNHELLGRLEAERREVEQKLLNPLPPPAPVNNRQHELPFESMEDIEWITENPEAAEPAAVTASSAGRSTASESTAEPSTPTPVAAAKAGPIQSDMTLNAQKATSLGPDPSRTAERH
jgi:sec-independent protein translocase protein TatB